MPSVKNVLSYLHWRFHNSISKSPRQLLRIRAALKWTVNSSYHSVIENILVSRYITGLFNMYPQPVCPLRDIWDVNIVLEYWNTSPVNEDLPLMLLSQKVVLLLLIATMKRRSDIMLMRVDNYYFQPNAIVFPLLMYPKTYTISSKNDELRYIVVKKFAENVNICPLSAISHYIRRTSPFRDSQSLFITTQSPYRSASAMTVRRWILTGLHQSGVYVQKYSASSTRHASSSKAFFVGVAVDEVMRRAGWSCVSSFVLHYNLPINQEQAVKRARIPFTEQNLPRWQRNFSFASNVKNSHNVSAAKVLQKARVQVYKNAVKFNTTPFVAAPPAVPRLILSKPIITQIPVSAMFHRRVYTCKKPKTVQVSSVPILSGEADCSSTDPASD